MFIFMITSRHWYLSLGRGPSALLCLGAYNAVKTALLWLTLFLVISHKT